MPSPSLPLSPPLRVVVTGSESTGKTTLARRLAVRYDAAWAAEFSRTYAESLGRPLTAGDVEPIAWGTLAADDAAVAEARSRGSAIVVLDTDLASTLVYARHYYGLVPRWIEPAWRERRPALYLLCHPDVPWEPDGVRDQPTERERLHAAFASRVAGAGVAVAHIQGADWDAREATADAAVADVVRLLAPGDDR